MTSSPASPRVAQEIPRRRLDLAFDPAAVPESFYAGDPALTQVWAALSLVFPDGERFFVESVAHYRDRLDDPELSRAVKGFAAQEGMHAREHAAFNAMLRAQGLQATEEIERGARRLLGL